MRYQTRTEASTRRIVCNLIASYSAYVQALKDERESILHGTPASGEKVQCDAGNSTESKAARLMELEQSFKAKAVNAMDEAKCLVAVDIENEAMKHKVVRAIWMSCVSPRNYPYRGNLCVSRRDFYRRRNDFIHDIAVSLGLK